MAEMFQDFFGLFVAAGKALSHWDMQRACTRWVSLSDEEKPLALECARQTCVETGNPRYLALPANFLDSKPWTRVAMLRSLPVLKPQDLRAIERHKEMMDILEEES